MHSARRTMDGTRRLRRPRLAQRDVGLACFAHLAGTGRPRLGILGGLLAGVPFSRTSSAADRLARMPRLPCRHPMVARRAERVLRCQLALRRRNHPRSAVRTGTGDLCFGQRQRYCAARPRFRGLDGGSGLCLVATHACSWAALPGNGLASLFHVIRSASLLALSPAPRCRGGARTAGHGTARCRGVAPHRIRRPSQQRPLHRPGPRGRGLRILVPLPRPHRGLHSGHRRHCRSLPPPTRFRRARHGQCRTPRLGMGPRRGIAFRPDRQRMPARRRVGLGDRPRNAVSRGSGPRHTRDGNRGTARTVFLGSITTTPFRPSRCGERRRFRPFRTPLPRTGAAPSVAVGNRTAQPAGQPGPAPAFQLPRCGARHRARRSRARPHFHRPPCALPA